MWGVVSAEFQLELWIMAFRTEERGDEFSGLAANVVQILKCFLSFHVMSPCRLCFSVSFTMLLSPVTSISIVSSRGTREWSEAFH